LKICDAKLTVRNIVTQTVKVFLKREALTV